MVKKHHRKKRKYLAGLILLAALGIIELILILHQADKQPGSSNQAATKVNSASSSPSFKKSLHSVNEANSLWAVVNKGRVLPGSYVPTSLVVPKVPLGSIATSQEMRVRADAAAAMEAMFSAAKVQGINLMLASGYRSYADQVSTYGNFVKQDGQVSADTYSARPGHSEHQTGLAADLEPTSRQCQLQDCFGATAEGKWLAGNAYKYGFIIRYQKNTESLTGYIYEPWHVRFVGIDLSAQINQTGQTLEQLFGLPSYTTYPAQMYQLQ